MTSAELIMPVCKGTLWIVDRSCEIYNRLWCLYEAYKFVIDVRNDKEYKFDVYTPVEDKDFDGTYGAVGITDGYIPSDHDNLFLKTERESKFPLDRVLQAIIKLDINHSLISDEEDRKFILNTIAGQSVEKPILDNHKKYEEFNHVFKSLFLAPMMERIKKDVKDKTVVDGYSAILNSLRPRNIHIKLNNNSELDDAYYQKIVNINLPSTIEEFRIFFHGRYHVDGKEVKELENYTPIGRCFLNIYL